MTIGFRSIAFLGGALLGVSTILSSQSAQRISGRVVWTSADGDDVTLSAPARLAVDAAGRVFVPEPKESVVYVFGPTGAYLQKIGRQGGGPGEFQTNCCAAIDPSGRLWVRDVEGARYVVFALEDKEGRFLAKPVAVVAMPHKDVNRWIALNFDQQGNLIDVGTRPDASDPALGKITRYSVNLSGKVVRSAVLNDRIKNVTPPYRMTVGKRDTVTTKFFYQPWSSRALIADGPLGQYATAGSGKYDITWFDFDGSVRRTIARTVEAPLLGDNERTRAQATMQRIAQQAGTTVAALPFTVPKRKPPLLDLQFDPDGRLWVERAMPARALHEYDVYSPSGTLLFIAVWPALPNLTFYGAARGQSAWATTLDKDEVPHIVKVDFPLSRP